MNKIKKGDQVIVVTGRDKGKTGEVLQIMSDGRALINNVNVVKKHTKPNPMAGVTGGILEKEAPIQVSNIAIFNPTSSKADKVRIEGEGKDKHRVRLQEHYVKNVVPQLQEKFNYSSAMEMPRITKISLNMGLGEAVTNKKIVDSAVADLEAIAGQKPVVCLARKSVAAFKIRDGWPIGAKVNLRRDRMYEFLDRLISVAIPRIRDFRGLNAKSFDGRGNYTFGLKEQIVFPEIDYDKVDALRGMDVTITTSAKTNEEAEALLRAFNFPLRTK